jgi:hypothetical protein
MSTPRKHAETSRVAPVYRGVHSLGFHMLAPCARRPALEWMMHALLRGCGEGLRRDFLMERAAKRAGFTGVARPNRSNAYRLVDFATMHVLCRAIALLLLSTNSNLCVKARAQTRSYSAAAALEDASATMLGVRALGAKPNRTAEASLLPPLPNAPPQPSVLHLPAPLATL